MSSYRKRTIFFSESITEEEWHSLKTYIINRLKKLSAEDVVNKGNAVLFKGTRYWDGRNILNCISSGTITFDFQKKIITYNISFFHQLMPGLVLLILCITLVVLFPVVRNAFFVFFCLGNLLIILVLDWYIRDQFSQFIHNCIAHTSVSKFKSDKAV